MNKSNLKKLLRLFNLLITFQLTFYPYAMAIESTETSSSINWADSVNIAQTISQIAATATTSAYNATGNQYNSYKAQFNQTLRLTPAKADDIPAAFDGCLVLPASGNSLMGGARCSQQHSQTIGAGYAAAVMDVAETNLMDIQNYLTEGHERYTSQGVGCYKQKIQNLDNLLDQREKQLAVYKENLKNMLDQFNLKNKALLENVKVKSALLNGGSENQDRIKDYKFEANLLGNTDTNNACGSILASGIIQKQGQQGGMRGIASFLEQTKNSPAQNSMSASEVLTKQKQIEKEVDELAYKLSNRMQNSGALVSSVDEISFRGSILGKDNKALNEILTNFNLDTENTINNLVKDTAVTSAVQGEESLAGLYQQVSNGSITLDSLNESLDTYERNQKNTCFSTSFKATPFGNSNTFAKSLRKQNVSSKVAREKDLLFAQQLNNIINNSSLDIDEKLRRIQSTQEKGVNSAYYIQLGTSVQIGSKTIYADTPLKPAQLVEVLVDVCNDNYSATNPNNSSGYSQAQAVSKLKDFAAKREQIQKSASTQLYSQVRKEMKSCPSDTSTGVADNSCTNALNTNSAGFCVKTAVKCARNMNSCYARAQEQVNTMIASQKADVANYNNQVNVLRTNLKKQITSMTQFLQNGAKTLDAQLDLDSDTRFEMPEINFEIAEDYFKDSKSGIESDLKMLDPEAYINKVTADLNNLSASLKNQRQGIAQALNEKVKLYTANYSKQKKHWQDMIAECQGALDNYNKQLAKENEAVNKNNAEIAEACNELQAFGQHPTTGAAEDLATDLGKVVQLQASTAIGSAFNYADKIAIGQIRSFNSSCGSSKDEDSSIYIPGGSKESQKVTTDEFCAEMSGDKDSDIKKLYPVSGIKQINLLCKFDNSECSNDAFKNEVTELGLCKIIKDDQLDRTNDKDKCEASGKPLDPKDSLDVKFALSEGVKCNPLNSTKEDRKLAREKLRNYVAGYNCLKDRERAGEIKVSVCNADLANSMMNAKGLGINTADNIGRIIGSSGLLK